MSARRDKPSSWLDSALGQTVLTQENRLLGAAVRRIHGDTLLWSGVSAGTADLSRRSMVRHRVYAALPGVADSELQRAAADDMSPLVTDLAELPLRNRCVDAIVMHHTLERCGDPRAALREASRVLQPGGQMIICGFNRWGLFSLCRWSADTPDEYANAPRIRDWLDVLGFESVTSPEYALFRPPWSLEAFDDPRWRTARSALQRLGLPFGNLFVLHVRKKNLSIRPDWNVAPRRRVALAGAAYPKLKLVDTRRKLD